MKRPYGLFFLAVVIDSLSGRFDPTQKLCGPNGSKHRSREEQINLEETRKDYNVNE